ALPTRRSSDLRAVLMPVKLCTNVVRVWFSELKELKRAVAGPMDQPALLHIQALARKQKILFAVRVVGLVFVVTLFACPYRENKRICDAAKLIDRAPHIFRIKPVQQPGANRSLEFPVLKWNVENASNLRVKVGVL